jgi:uncharacterized protein YggE
MEQYEGFKKLQDEYMSFLAKNLIESATISTNCEKVQGERVYHSKNSINIYAAPNTVEDSINLIETG